MKTSKFRHIVNKLLRKHLGPSVQFPSHQDLRDRLPPMQESAAETLRVDREAR